MHYRSVICTKGMNTIIFLDHEGICAIPNSTIMYVRIAVDYRPQARYVLVSDLDGVTVG